MTIETSHEAITTELSIWAVPKSTWRMEEDNTQFPFEYKIYAGNDKPYADGAVRVETEPFTMHVTAGIDLLFQAVDTLEQAKKDAYDEYLRISAGLDKKLATLRLLSHTPDPDAIEGEVVDPLAEADDDDQQAAELASSHADV